VARRRRAQLRRLRDAVLHAFPELDDPDALIARGGVTVGGRVLRNPASLVPAGVPVGLTEEARLRGEAKLEAALSVFEVSIASRVALDAGAAAGGFTRVLLANGVRRVYAVDAGHGQLLGSLRQDARVVNLEATNLGSLTPALVADTVDVVTLDLSYLSLADAVPQLDAIRLASAAELVALVKPQFELGLATPPSTRTGLERALAHAAAGIATAGWHVIGTVESPVRGARGSTEFLLHARR
jgi:23S rRNA (cytidine1920-2'-O)/16S rRNA (cytidine1409-2'-O)-methyltransferase